MPSFRRFDMKSSGCFKYLSGVLLLLLWTPLVSGQPIHAVPAEFLFNQSGSSISFLASSTLHTVKGSVKKFKGKVLFPAPDEPSLGSVVLEIEAQSLDTNHEARDKKIREDCLEVARFTMIRFKSLEIRSGRQSGKVEVLGLLDLHGVQKRILIPVDYTYIPPAFHVKGKTIVKLSDFQIPEPRFLFLRVKDEVEIEFDIQASSSPLPS